MNRKDILIEAEELVSKINDPNVRIYDATILFFRDESDPTEYENYLKEHIPGAAFFNHQDFSDTKSKYMYTVLPEEELAAQIGKIGIDKDNEVIFYTSDMLPCATRAWWVLHYAGHDHIRVLNGGLAAWKNAGGEIEEGPGHYQPTTFKCQLRPQLFASKEEVQAAIGDNAVCTVNTLTQEIYDKAHISGSSLFPCSDLMDEMLAFLPDADLSEKLNGEAKYDRVITYCGGGIAATVNAMAHLMAGNKNVSVYDGSMDEWVGEKLPITHGGNS